MTYGRVSTFDEASETLWMPPAEPDRRRSFRETQTARKRRWTDGEVPPAFRIAKIWCSMNLGRLKHSPWHSLLPEGSISGLSTLRGSLRSHPSEAAAEPWFGGGATGESPRGGKAISANELAAATRLTGTSLTPQSSPIPPPTGTRCFPRPANTTVTTSGSRAALLFCTSSRTPAEAGSRGFGITRSPLVRSASDWS